MSAEHDDDDAAQRVQMREILKGIDLLRASINVLQLCREDFLQSYTADQLMKLARLTLVCDWDFLPDQWAECQIVEALEQGRVPRWRLDAITRQYVPVFADDDAKT
jgi:hypothetical protein